MKRRKLLLGVGVAAVGSGVAGTGAFTQVEADRDVRVAVADDSDAYLALRPAETGTDGESVNGVYAQSVPGTSGANELFLDFNEVSLGDARGPGSNAKYNFNKVFAIQNDGTQPVYIDSEFDDANLSGINFYVETSDSYPLDGNSVLELDTGHEAFIGVQIDTTGIDIVDGEMKNQEVVATINASGETPEDSVTVLDENGEEVGGEIG